MSLLKRLPALASPLLSSGPARRVAHRSVRRETCWPSEEPQRHRQRRQPFARLPRERLSTKRWEWKMGLGAAKGCFSARMGKKFQPETSGK